MLNPYCAAIEEGLKKQDSVRTLFQGTSMLPTLEAGMQISVEKIAPPEIRQADIILYQNGPSLVAHRVIKITCKEEKIIFITKGDNHAYLDCSYIQEDNVIGRVSAAFMENAPEKNILMQNRHLAQLYLLSGNLCLFARKNRLRIPRFIRLPARYLVGGFFLGFKKLIHCYQRKTGDVSGFFRKT